jgi:hypothetical protein
VTQQEQDRLITLCYEHELVARHSVTREGPGLRVDLKSFHYPSEVAILSKGSGLAAGFVVRWVGRQTGQPGGTTWYDSAEKAVTAIEQQYRAGEAAKRLGGIL